MVVHDVGACCCSTYSPELWDDVGKRRGRSLVAWNGGVDRDCPLDL